MTDTEQKLARDVRQMKYTALAIATFLYEEASKSPKTPGAREIMLFVDNYRAEQDLRNRYNEALCVIDMVRQDYPDWVQP